MHELGKKRKSTKKTLLLHLALIAVLGLLAYSNTFDVPFQFDDIENIVGNPMFNDFSYFTDSASAERLGHYRNVFTLIKTRSVGYLTFFANYKVHGLRVAGFHIVNLVIHIVNAVLVYFLINLTFRTPFLRMSVLKNRSCYIGLFSALFFVLHPVQTQAVTYIVQRFTSLATMFYLMSLVLYIQYRLRKIELKAKAPECHLHKNGNPETLAKKTRAEFDSTIKSWNNKRGTVLLYCAALLFAVLAMKTKEIALTLPLVVAFYEFIFFRAGLKRRIIYLFPFLVAMLIIPLSYMFLIRMDSSIEELMGYADNITRAQEISRLDYFFTEFRVIVTYLRLLVLPVNQNVDYDYPVYHSIFALPVFLSMIVLLGVFGFGVCLLYRAHIIDRGSEAHSSFITDHASRLVAFGIFWFFITLSVESSVIPLQVIYEHRIYLPSVGIFSSLVVMAFLLMERYGKITIRHSAVSLAVLLLLLFSCATYMRNTIWKNTMTLWEDSVRKSPQKARPHVNFGNALMFKGEIDGAIKHYDTAVKLEPDLAEAYNGLGCAYNAKGLIEKAIEYFRIAIKMKPDITEAHVNLGAIYASNGLIDKAIEHFQTVIKLRPEYAEAHRNLGIVYNRKNLSDKALEHLNTALRLKPNDADTHYYLGIACADNGFAEKAEEHFHATIKIKPDHVKAHNKLGILYKAKGRIDKAIQHYQIALKLTPNNEKIHNNLGNAYDDMGFTNKAIRHYENALRLKPDYADAHFNLGIAYMKANRMNNARRQFEAALQINPDYYEARRLLERIVR